MDANLFGREVVAVDGSKFRAVNSKKNNYNEKKIDQHLEYIDKQTAQYLQALEENDRLHPTIKILVTNIKDKNENTRSNQ